MGMGSWWHWVILLAVALLLFGGGGKIPKLMRDMGQGITAFKRGLKEDKEKPAEDDAAAALEANPKSNDKAASS